MPGIGPHFKQSMLGVVEPLHRVLLFTYTFSEILSLIALITRHPRTDTHTAFRPTA